MAKQASSKSSKKSAAPKKKPAIVVKPARPVRPTRAVGKPKPQLAIPAKAALAATIPHASHVQFTANSQALLVARQKKKSLTLYDLASQTETPPLPALPTFSAVALSADSRHIAMGTSTGILAAQSSQTGKIAWKTKATGHPVGALAFSLDGSLLFAVAPPPEGHIPETALAPSAAGEPPKPDPKHDRWIRALKTTTGEPEPAFAPVPGSLCCHLALSPDGVFLAHSELHSNSVLIWHLPTRQISTCIRLPRNRGPIKSISFGITVRQLYIAQQTQLTAWNAENGTQILALEEAGIRSLALLDHGDTLAALRITSDGTQTLELLKADTGFLRRSIKLLVKDPGPLSASPDGTLLALPTQSACYVWQSAKLAG